MIQKESKKCFAFFNVKEMFVKENSDFVLNYIYRKTPLPTFLFKSSYRLEACNFIKNRLWGMCFLVILRHC